ncbi:hypothetical protein GF318_02680 [Candidatus Micrarchaeota archaeon]|nr:hypothetical protein [Candidatus Micrarchaeota archaeon]
MKVTLTHIGVISLGRLLAIWSFVIGLIFLLLSGLVLGLATLLGIFMSDSPVEMLGGGLIGFVMFIVFGMIVLVLNSILAFIIGAVAAIVYNIILGVGGGIDMDFRERKTDA